MSVALRNAGPRYAGVLWFVRDRIGIMSDCPQARCQLRLRYLRDPGGYTAGYDTTARQYTTPLWAVG